MSLIQRLLVIDKRLNELKSIDLNSEYSLIMKLSGPKFYLKLNQFEKKIGVK